MNNKEMMKEYKKVCKACEDDDECDCCDGTTKSGPALERYRDYLKRCLYDTGTSGYAQSGVPLSDNKAKVKNITPKIY